MELSISRQMKRRVSPALVQKLWYLCLLALVIPVYLGHFALPAPLQYLMYALSLAAYALLIVKIFLWDGYDARQLPVLAGCLVLLGVGTVVSGNRCFLSSFLLAFSARDIPFDKLCRVLFWFFVSTFLLNVLLVAVGVLEDTVTVRGEVWGNGNLRHSLGFGHPNTLGFWGMLVVCSGMLTYFRSKRPLWVAAVWLVISWQLFRLTDSKAALLASIAAIVLCVLLSGLPGGSSRAARLAAGGMLLAVTVFLLLCLFYREDSGFFRLCNTLLSQRLAYANQGFRLFGVSPFGAHVDFKWDPVDSLYAYAPICLGVLPSLIYLGLNLWGLYRCVRLGRWDIAAIAFAGMLYSTMEYGLMNPVHLPIFACTAGLEPLSPQKPSD